MTVLQWVAIIAHAIGEGLPAALSAAASRRAQLTGDAPPIGWKERQAAADAAAKGTGK